MPNALRLPDLRPWLQERQYVAPYHWSYRGGNLLQYQLRTRVVLDLLDVAPLTSASRSRRARPLPRLLDVGCGDARFLAESTWRVEGWGVDATRRALGFARRLAPRARFARCAADALCFPDGSFDVVTLLDVIEHIPDDREHAVVREARRVLRPGGQLIISTNTDRSFVEWKHYRHYSMERFRGLYDDGFDDVRLVGLVPYFPTLRFWMALPIAWRLFRDRVRTCPPEEAQIVVGVGRKRA